MPEIFPPSFNSVVRAIIFGGGAVLCGVIASLYIIEWSPWATRARTPYTQPVQFSHKHHAGQLGIDCRYCHVGVEVSSFAGVPPTETCMTCHSQLYTDAALLEPVRQSLVDKKPLQWVRVHDLPNFVYFNHAIHVNKGIGCVACHGPTGREMNLTYQTKSLYMSWCLDCHQHPANFANETQEVFNINWQPLKIADPIVGKERALQLIKTYRIQPKNVLMGCYTCHR